MSEASISMNLNWVELSRLPVGTRVMFTTDWDIFPIMVVPAGTPGTIVEQGLNEMGCLLFVLPDDPHIRHELADWEGVIQIGGHLRPGTIDDEWFEESPLVADCVPPPTLRHRFVSKARALLKWAGHQ